MPKNPPEFRRKVLDLLDTAKSLMSRPSLGVTQASIYVWRRQHLIDALVRAVSPVRRITSRL